VAVPVFAALVVAGSLTAFPYFMPQLAVYGLFFACVACGNRFGGVLSNKAALILGEASFSIYLLHGIVLDILFVNILPVIAPGSRIVALAALPLAAACVACTAACVFLLIEKPGIRYGKKLARTWLPGSRRTPIPVAAESPRP
jgi:peptidoglycan/LPS O-acetylase OafA/YrhL